jgi:glycerol-3-phosphate dehydrogenase
MAEDAINQAIAKNDLPKKSCATENLKIHVFCEDSEKYGDFAIYGADAENIRALIDEHPILGEKLHCDLPYCAAEIVWAIRFEMAQTLEDVLARRTRALFLNARAAMEIAPQVAGIMARESGKDKIWIDEQIRDFNEIAKNYLPF